MRALERRSSGAAASGPTAARCPAHRLCRGRTRLGWRLGGHTASSPQAELTSPTPVVEATARAAAPTWRSTVDEEAVLPLYTCLDGDILTPANKFAYYEALRSGLKALRALGINGISVDVYWGIVEGAAPMEYDWSSYKQLFALIRDEGFMAQVCLCFHGTEAVPLPAWVLEAGRANPDIYFTDRAGVRNTHCISLGVDEVPALDGRSALGCYRDLMMSFRSELEPLLGSTIVDVCVGLGPDGELKYPAHPHDRRWNFPGIGEFQCYDKYMLSGLRACSHQVSQPSWGLGGPHDAGAYTVWPHQTGFFNQYGNWSSPYGKFFLQWYSDMLMQHADSVLGIAKDVLLPPAAGSSGGGGLSFNGSSTGGIGLSSSSSSSSSRPGFYGNGYGSGNGIWRGSAAAASEPPRLRLHAKLPGVHWWYNTSSRAPELTAGYYNTTSRDGYLPIMEVLSRHGISVRLRSAELRSADIAPQQACCDPERQLAQQRTVAAALLVPVGLENAHERFDESALARLEASLFDTSVHEGIELPQVQSLVFNRMCDSMFEPGNWSRFKEFVRRVRNRADTLVVPAWRWRGGPGASMDGMPTPLTVELPMGGEPPQQQQVSTGSGSSVAAAAAAAAAAMAAGNGNGNGAGAESGAVPAVAPAGGAGALQLV
ncbi:hypothetical protein HYH02_008832 [Chlamydomonas schloesseri]|uniref:Beta-amylase n=1 Tax=Chlamydomonas schloesseri TaxID=2026947 RepID=A0A835WDF5_9CHLO|nr:hypothetical protein HYH02_008832 [Chlamydomonas schloesseri]|eukprot:KAG2445367.1 hypothetical protein HYH02_008832 [Chlamydomonas schloesseri]